jgi:hypothetical protein
MSEKAGREQLARRSSFRRSLAETSLPPEFLEELLEKRKQLDESIHKFIAAKERDYKHYERELRQQHKLAQGQNGPNGISRRRLSPETAQVDAPAVARRVASPSSGASAVKPGRHSSTDNADAVEKIDRSALAGLRDRRASLERDKDFVGVFTPAYLSAIDDAGRDLERISSAPSAVPTAQQLHVPGQPDSLERSNSDSVVQAKPKRPSQLVLAHRNSSSGSSADGRLTSAMKSPSQRPKQKRVSLAVGDSIVAPSDSVPAPPTSSNTPSHSRQRSPLPGPSVYDPRHDTPTTIPARSLSVEMSLLEAEQAAMANTASNLGNLAIRDQSDTGEAPASNSVMRPIPRSSDIDPDGDIFDLEAAEDELTRPQPAEFENALESDEEYDDIAGRVNTTYIDGEPTRYDAETGIIPEPLHGKDSAVPSLDIGPGSAVSSQQPIRPGFRRPSVIDDPVYRGPSYATAEQDAVENEVYASSFNRPSSKGSFTVGSLGESYMAANAEEMLKLRNARSQSEVKS